MASETDLRRAILALAAADTGTGGLVKLLAKAHPIVRYGSTGARAKPIVTLLFYDAAPRPPTLDSLDVWAQFDIEVSEAALGLEDKVADRLGVVLTNAAFTSKGLDAAVFWGRRRNLSELAEGGQRKVVEARFKLHR